MNGIFIRSNSLYINTIVYTEVSIGFDTIEEVESTIEQIGIKVLEIPREALFLAGKTFLRYKKIKGREVQYCGIFSQEPMQPSLSLMSLQEILQGIKPIIQILNGLLRDHRL